MLSALCFTLGCVTALHSQLSYNDACFLRSYCLNIGLHPRFLVLPPPPQKPSHVGFLLHFHLGLCKKYNRHFSQIRWCRECHWLPINSVSFLPHNWGGFVFLPAAELGKGQGTALSLHSPSWAAPKGAADASGPADRQRPPCHDAPGPADRQTSPCRAKPLLLSSL